MIVNAFAAECNVNFLSIKGYQACTPPLFVFVLYEPWIDIGIAIQWKTATILKVSRRH